MALTAVSVYIDSSVHQGRRRSRGRLAVVAATALVMGVLQAPAASASTVSGAAFTGGAGTVLSSGKLYAKQGGTLTLTVTTSSDTKCVDVSGAFTAHDQSTVARSTWTFVISAPPGDGPQSVTAAASPSVNPQNKCTGQSGSAQTSYILDNTGPTLGAALAPAANVAGWNNATVGLTWSATDAGSGIATGPTPATASVSAETAGASRSSTASDRLGNSGSGSVTVKLDTSAPTISATRTPAPTPAGWNNSDVTVALQCADTLSGIKACAGGGVVSAEGTNQSATGTAVDNADNTASVTVTGISIDRTAPSLTGAATTPVNGFGWYSGDVSISWTASDALAGLLGPAPADSTISGEGSGLTASASITDGAGNTTNADSAPVNIDRTAPTTGISGTSNSWTDGNVEVSLTPADSLSGVASTTYSLDGGEPQIGTTFTLTTEGDHTVSFFSTDKAGNSEDAQTGQVKIDKTAPTIGHSFTPLTYIDGAWTNQNVTVIFDCTDSGSGLAGCTAPVTTTTDGAAQQVVGTASDSAGNSATDVAIVNIDKTAPTITAAADRAANDVGWYQDDVTVSFTCADALSGVSSCPAALALSEGADQAAAGRVTDGAGNSASAGVSGINVDRTAPTLTGSFSTGWHARDVTVTWSCTDALSGAIAQPADQTVTGEGADLSASASCSDTAGNVAGTTAGGIQIDRTAPTTSASVPAPPASGWYADSALVVLSGLDGLSGVAATHFRVDGGAAVEYLGAFLFDQKGTHILTFWSSDVAGNVEDGTGNVITLNVDGQAPTTTVINPISPASGWFVVSGIPVAFDANDAESGIAATYYQIDTGAVRTYGEPFTADLSTGNHVISYWSVDLAGNVEATQSTDVRVDTVPPTITGNRAPAPNVNGWNNTDVIVTFTCTDADSGVDGIAGCGPDATVANEGEDQKVRGDTVDVAGNANSAMVDHINIDKTAPSLTGLPTTDANGAGWYNADVAIAWAGVDGLSGIDRSTQPASTTITGEGSNLDAAASIADNAGNQKTATVSGIKIDRTAPIVSGGPTTSPNGAGWYRDEVVVDFSCSDTLSGVAFCPTSKVIAGNGANQTVTSEPAGDKAGNDSAGTTVGGINIDGTAPTTTANNQCTKTNGYCTGPTATVVLSSMDQAGLSGVKEIHYRIDGGAGQVAAGSTTTVGVPLDGSGSGTVSYWAVDNAGNAETPSSVALQWDNIAPTVTHTLSPLPNANDWNKGAVTVTFTAKDDDSGSGVASAPAPVTVSTETAGQLVNGSATDTAGNVGTDSVTVRLDLTAPTISASIVGGTLGANGWYIGPVKVHFACSDALSGIATCPDDVTLTDNGSNTASGTTTDKADNSATATLSGINIDRELPTISNVNVAGGFYVLGTVPAATCTAVDSFSGLTPGSCTVTVTGGNANGVGTLTYTATATDLAGNKVTTIGSYKVVYRFDGFLQPINDTAHQIGTSTSVFKSGSTVPVKFQLKKADGSIVQANSAPAWLTPVKGSAMSLPVDESAYAASADSGMSFRYDSTATQYIYNWKTGSGGSYYRIGVTLDDGQTYYVNIALR